jgi:hypothetical protein
MPRIFDELLDRMVLSFETLFDSYRQARLDHIYERRLHRYLFTVVVGHFRSCPSQTILLTRNPVTHGACSLLAQSHGVRGFLVRAIWSVVGPVVPQGVPRHARSKSSVGFSLTLLEPHRLPTPSLGPSSRSCALRSAHRHCPHSTHPIRGTRCSLRVPACSGFVCSVGAWGVGAVFY